MRRKEGRKKRVREEQRERVEGKKVKIKKKKILAQWSEKKNV